MSCPDNLLINQRKGALGSDDQAKLDAHLAGCPTCRLTLRVGADFDQLLETVPGDDLIAARFARNLGPTFVSQRTQRRTEPLRYAWVAAALLAIMASSGLAAARLGVWPFGRSATELTSSPSAPPPHARKPTPTITVVPVVAPAPTAQDVDIKPAVERAPSAAELFAQANARRRDGEASRARHLYRQLQQLHPRSPEVEVSHVSLGRVYLELGEAREALEQFDRYLTRHPRGPLAEEALFGKASALQRLRRTAAERETWRALLVDFPSSVYAERARHRIEQIP